MDKDLVNISKFLSYVLRHNPQEIGLSLDSNGWGNIDELIILCNLYGHNLSKDILLKIATNDIKERFAIKDNRIRANQGHSINIDLHADQIIPPPTLYHGTAVRFFNSIMTLGLKKMQRQYVHLSTNEDTAYDVGKRHGKPIVLKIDSGLMLKEGFVFFLSSNGIFLTEYVPPRFISIARK